MHAAAKKRDEGLNRPAFWVVDPVVFPVVVACEVVAAADDEELLVDAEALVDPVEPSPVEVA